jgi:hypothetical protein
MFVDEVRPHRELRAGSGQEHTVRVFRLAEAGREAIFANHCTPKRRASSQWAPLSDTPAYDPAQESVEEVVVETGRRVLVYTAKVLFGSGPPVRRRYVVLRRGDTWLVDKVEAYDEDKAAWVRWAL